MYIYLACICQSYFFLLPHRGGATATKTEIKSIHQVYHRYPSQSLNPDWRWQKVSRSQVQQLGRKYYCLLALLKFFSIDSSFWHALLNFLHSVLFYSKHSRRHNPNQLDLSLPLGLLSTSQVFLTHFVKQFVSILFVWPKYLRTLLSPLYVICLYTRSSTYLFQVSANISYNCCYY